jgi:hypothetical protein
VLTNKQTNKQKLEEIQIDEEDEEKQKDNNLKNDKNEKKFLQIKF